LRAVVATTPDVPQGLVAGKYRLSRLLGRGGMGSVWEGLHTTLGTRVAVKFIDAEYAESPEARSRFENEARAAATLRSKHVVEVYDHGVMTDGRPFIVMEFLEGEPLDKRLDRFGRLAPKDTARILHQVCRALSKAHAASIVHRDLKPENVFLVWDDEDGADIAKVVDFGIAKFTDAALGPSSATRTGSVLGTPYYMSPEQARGLRSVDHRSDIWSLGVIAYRCIVGALPFEGEAIGDLLVKLCTAPVPVPSQLVPDVPPGFDAFIQRALSRDPAERFQTSQEFAESLSAICGLSVRGPYGSRDGSALASGPHPAATQAVSQHRVHGPFGITPGTGAPITQTPTPVSTPRRSNAGLLGAAIGGAVVLAIGIGVAAKLASNDPAVAPSGSVSTAAPAPEPPAAAAPPAVAPPPPQAVTVEPTPAAAPPAASSAPPRAPVRNAAPRAARPPAAREPARVEPSRVEAPRPPPPRTTKPPIDVGY